MSILGLTDHFLHERVALPTYSSLQSHISSEALRLGNETPAQQAEAMALRAAQAGNRALDAVVTKVGHIGDLSDYRFQLLRHWSLYSALKHSPYVASRLETWTEQGKSKLRLLLTELGIPTADAKQAFRVLGVEKKTRLDELIDARGADARYNIPDIRFKSFVRVSDTLRHTAAHHDTAHPPCRWVRAAPGAVSFLFWARCSLVFVFLAPHIVLCFVCLLLAQQQTPTLSLSACDMVQSMCALLELPHHDNAGKERYQDWSWERGFWACFDALACDQKAVGLVLRGLGQSVALSRALLRQAEALTVGKAVRPGGDFRYAILPDSPDAHFFAHPLALTKLALFISECVRAQKGSLLPLVLAAPVPERGAHLVLAVLGTQLNPDVLLKKSALQRPNSSSTSMVAQSVEKATAVAALILIVIFLSASFALLFPQSLRQSFPHGRRARASRKGGRGLPIGRDRGRAPPAPGGLRPARACPTARQAGVV